ncbi:hypothetical protein BJ508DRAFT_331427 [Ascobolus immersus RN42]|uniref:F-box domain-containing protein n=1 Tax=Ascobolus immersus RN42 TaxID=1160509 RepID=A0A3N4HQP2_ASCIM|nr:hypothetical protein BJ508DRAFT_331427 [Ascobolus immersus RN42]
MTLTTFASLPPELLLEIFVLIDGPLDAASFRNLNRKHRHLISEDFSKKHFLTLKEADLFKFYSEVEFDATIRLLELEYRDPDSTFESDLDFWAEDLQPGRNAPPSLRRQGLDMFRRILQRSTKPEPKDEEIAQLDREVFELIPIIARGQFYCTAEHTEEMSDRDWKFDPSVDLQEQYVDSRNYIQQLFQELESLWFPEPSKSLDLFLNSYIRRETIDDLCCSISCQIPDTTLIAADNPYPVPCFVLSEVDGLLKAVKSATRILRYTERLFQFYGGT